MNIIKKSSSFGFIAGLLLSVFTGNAAAAINLSQSPLFLAEQVASNVMVMLDNINEKIDDQSIRFSSLERPIKNSAAWWAGETLNIAAFTFETSRNLRIEQRIQFHLQLVKILLHEKGIF